MRTAHGAYRAGVRDPAPAQQFVQPGHGALRLFSKARAEIEKAMLVRVAVGTPNERKRNLGKGLPNDPDNVPERRTSGRLALIARCLRMARQPYRRHIADGLGSVRERPAASGGSAGRADDYAGASRLKWSTPPGTRGKDLRMTGLPTDFRQVLEAAMGSIAGWLPVDTAPEDQHVILMTTGGHVGEAPASRRGHWPAEMDVGARASSPEPHRWDGSQCPPASAEGE